MDEPATEMDLMDPAKASRGLDLGLKNAMASRGYIMRIARIKIRVGSQGRWERA